MGAGRGEHGRSAVAGSLVLLAGQQHGKGQRLWALAAAFAGQATIIQLPGRLGRRKDLRWLLSKPGFSLFHGIAGRCSLPRAGSPASGAGEGFGMPSAETESTLQDPGGEGCLGPSTAEEPSG